MKDIHTTRFRYVTFGQMLADAGADQTVEENTAMARRRKLHVPNANVTDMADRAAELLRSAGARAASAPGRNRTAHGV